MKSLPEHVVVVEGGQPVAVGIGVIVACPPPVTLDEGDLAEKFYTGARRNQGVRGALCTCSCLLEWMVKTRQRLVKCYMTRSSKSGEKKNTSVLTMTNEYPVHRESQLWGQSGISVVWLWMAITLEVVSQTEHLNRTYTQTSISHFLFYISISRNVCILYLLKQ